jgi:hypothetical protein
MNDQAAFPMAIPAGCEGYEDGMTLRDYFAGQALLGILSGRDPDSEFVHSRLAGVCYKYADAMLEARDN